VAEDTIGMDAEQVTLHGYTVDRLSALADARGARLIVVGTCGRGRARTALLGSTSQELAARASRPAVAGRPEFHPPQLGGGDAGDHLVRGRVRRVLREVDAP